MALSATDDSLGVDDAAPLDAGDAGAAAVPEPRPRAADGRTLLLAGIFALLLLHGLRVAQPVVLPLALAVLGHLALTPVVRALGRARLPAPLAAALLVGALVGAAVAGTSLLATPASRWVTELPVVARDVERELRFVREPMAELSAAAESVEKLAAGPGAEREVAVERTSLTELVFASTQSALGAAVAMTALLYFLLASGDGFLPRLVAVGSGVAGKRRAIELVHAAEAEISRYLLTVSLINAGLGVVVAGAMAALGVPNPVLWGVMAAAFNFVPFLGPAAATVVLALVALLAFDDPARIALVPCCFVLITAFEGLFVTPSLLGHRFRLSPVVVLLGLMLGWWLWGVPGALIAVPALMVGKIAIDHTPRLAAVSALWSR